MQFTAAEGICQEAKKHLVVSNENKPGIPKKYVHLSFTGVRLPVAFLKSRVSPGSLFHLGLSTPASTVVQILLCMGWYLWQKRKYDRLSALAAG